MDSRKTAILKHCRSPKTYQELSEELDIGYHAVWNLVQELVDASVLEEMPFNRRGTRQKQFRTRAFNPETFFTPETCLLFKIYNGEYNALQVINSKELEDLYHMVITIVFTALSAPMTEVLKGDMAGAPHSSVVEPKLMSAHALLSDLLTFLEQLIHCGVWDDQTSAKALFHTLPENINTEPILQAKARLFQIANERGW